MEEEPVHVNYKGIEVYKLQQWTQGPSMLQALNILGNFDLKGMGYNSARYINTVYQAMSLAFADRDFYYGDPNFSKDQPIKGLLSQEYARDRAKLIDPDHNNAQAAPGESARNDAAPSNSLLFNIPSSRFCISRNLLEREPGLLHLMLLFRL